MFTWKIAIKMESNNFVGSSALVEVCTILSATLVGQSFY